MNGSLYKSCDHFCGQCYTRQIGSCSVWGQFRGLLYLPPQTVQCTILCCMCAHRWRSQPHVRQRRQKTCTIRGTSRTALRKSRRWQKFHAAAAGLCIVGVSVWQKFFAVVNHSSSDISSVYVILVFFDVCFFFFACRRQLMISIDFVDSSGTKARWTWVFFLLAGNCTRKLFVRATPHSLVANGARSFLNFNKGCELCKRWADDLSPNMCFRKFFM